MLLSISSSALDRFLEAIQVPQSKYEAANTSFKSFCDWFQREESTIRSELLESFLQGSFRLGTAIRPTTDEDDYDLDIVVTLIGLKSALTQEDLKRKIGTEVKSYSASHRMTNPVDSRRCWTQSYADGSQFHVDILPSIPDEQALLERLTLRSLDTQFATGALAITDKTSPNYRTITSNWHNSNPRGYAEWFERRMGSVLRARKEAIALREGRAVDDIPTYRAQTPLQGAIQLLKFHRDVMFADDPEDRPISIIITTLAAQAYRGESNLPDALARVLDDMDDYIEEEHGISWVRNPSNALENFADKWVEYPARRTNFFKWLDTARVEFRRFALASEAEAKQFITENFGDEVAERFAKGRAHSDRKKTTTLSPFHRQVPPWDPATKGTVKIHRATKLEKGFRPKPFSSDSFPLSKGADLRFYGRTDVPSPYEVYWQIVNTGIEAERANSLRGGFDAGAVYSGKINRKESSMYSGTHSIECFIVKDGYLAARSGQFIVNIK